MGKPKFAGRYRGYLLDCHSPDPPVVTLERLDPKDYIETYKAANIDSLVVYAKGHWGDCYYDTKVGHKHPGLKCDFLKEIVELGHKNDMEVTAYYSLGFDNWAAIKNPDWALKKADGTPNRAGISQTWYNMCANSPYRDYALEQIAEIAGGYDVDGFFIDIFPLDLIHGICYCPYCERMAMSMWGKRVAELSWNEWVPWIVRQRTVLWEEIRDTVKRFLPEAYVIVNGSYIGEIVEREDYVYAEGSTVFFTLQARGWGKKYCQMGPGNLSPIYDPRPLDACKLDISSILAYGGRPMVFSEAQHTDGSLEQSFFDLLGSVYAEVKEKQEFVEEAEPEKCVGILHSEPTLLYYAGKEYTEKFYTSSEGAVNAALSLHYPVDIVYDRHLCAEELDAFDVLVLPNVVCMDDTQAGVIREYVRKGGKLLASFKTSLHDRFNIPQPNFNLADVFGADYLLDDATYAGNPFGSYLQCGEHEITDEFRGMTLGMPGPFLKVRSTSGESIGWHTLPATAQTPERFVNWGSPPPGMATEFPVVHLNTYGEGRVVYVTAPLFRYVSEGITWARQLIVNALKWLHPEPRIYVEGPSYVEATFSRQREPDRIVVHLLNRAVSALGGEAAPAVGARLRLQKGWFEARHIREVWPEERELGVQDRGHYLEVAVPPVEIHTMITISP